MKKHMTFTLSAFMLLFYTVIIMYSLFAILQINTLESFGIGMTFEVIGLMILATVILSSVASRSIKLGYLVPIIVVTLIYTIILDVINFTCIASMESSIFCLLHLGLLFVYGLVSIPMYIVGKR